jgi:hypothetical protein
MFHGALLAAGLVFGAVLITGVAVPEWRINHHFIETRGRLVATGLVRRSVDGTGTASVTWRPCVRLRYPAGGRERESWSMAPATVATPDRDAAAARAAGWRIGSEVTCWFDPDEPDNVVLERGYNWWMWLLTLLLPGALVGFGGSGLVRAVSRWRRSEEAIAAAPGFPGLLDPISPALRDAPDHPSVPSCEDLVNSPGTILRYRLPIESPENWTLLGLGLFALLWNAVLVVLFVGAGLVSDTDGRDWLRLAVLGPFFAVGCVGIGLFIRRLVLAAAVGTTRVEVSDHPLRPGGRYDVMLAQGGSGTLRRLEVSLELEEQATFRQGTDTRTERLVVWRRPVQSWHDVQLVPGTSFEARVGVVVPPEAMHSFASDHNAVRWRLVVRGTPTRWPPFVRVFPVIVFPAAPASAPGRPGPSLTEAAR